MSEGKKIWDEDWPLLVWFAVAMGATALLYPGLASELPIHWNMHGEADGFASKAVAVSINPAIALATYLLFVAMMFIDPLRENLTKFRGALRVFRWATPLFMIFLQMVLLFHWAEIVEFEVIDGILIGTGILTAVIGNFMTKVRPNYFVGIRVPWTLESEQVWRETHRMAGPLWFIGGLSFLAVPWLVPVAKFIYVVAIMTVITIVPVVFAFVRYRRLNA